MIFTTHQTQPIPTKPLKDKSIKLSSPKGAFTLNKNITDGLRTSNEQPLIRKTDVIPDQAIIRHGFCDTPCDVPGVFSDKG